MTISFEDVELDLGTVELRRAGVRVPVEPQVFDVLAYLVAHRTRVVTKEELMDAIWGGRFVTEAAVTSRIKQARQAIGDSGQAQRLIRTVHGKGYRFVGDAHERAATRDWAKASTGGAGTDEARTEEVRYAVSDDLQIAYQVTGRGERDIVLVAGFVSHLELDWADPRHAAFLDRLGSFGRLIRFDKRGTGMSDRPNDLPDLETRMHDVLTVMDAVGSRRAVLFGYSEGGPMASLMAATHPERVEALVLYGAYARRVRSDDYPWAPTTAEREQYAQRLATEWSWEADMRVMCPSADDAMARWWGQRARAAATPSTVRALLAMNTLVDVRDALGSVRVPTLVMHRRGDRDSSIDEGRYLAARIPGARFVELAGADHFVAINPDQILDQVEEFLTDVEAAPAPPGALGAVLALAGAEDAVRAAVPLLSGRPVRARSGHAVVIYDGPAAAVKASVSVLNTIASDSLGIGLHIAEVPREGSIVDGPGVDLAVSLAEQALPGRLLVSATVRDLVSGSGIALVPADDDTYSPA